LRTEAGVKVTDVKLVVEGTVRCMNGCFPSSVVKALLNCAWSSSALSRSLMTSYSDL